MTETKSEILCKNIFKENKNTTSKDKFTRAWIDLINQIEQSKKSVISKR